MLQDDDDLVNSTWEFKKYFFLKLGFLEEAKLSFNQLTSKFMKTAKPAFCITQGGREGGQNGWIFLLQN